MKKTTSSDLGFFETINSENSEAQTKTEQEDLHTHSIYGPSEGSDKILEWGCRVLLAVSCLFSIPLLILIVSVTFQASTYALDKYKELQSKVRETNSTTKISEATNILMPLSGTNFETSVEQLTPFQSGQWNNEQKQKAPLSLHFYTSPLNLSDLDKPHQSSSEFASQEKNVKAGGLEQISPK